MSHVKFMPHQNCRIIKREKAIKLRELTTPRLSHNLIKTNFEVCSSIFFKTKFQQEASSLNKKIQFSSDPNQFLFLSLKKLKWNEKRHKKVELIKKLSDFMELIKFYWVTKKFLSEFIDSGTTYMCAHS